jgi:membrane protein DedA with SNARE-associated domain
VSPSKKANRKIAGKKTAAVQKKQSKSSVRSSRVTTANRHPRQVKSVPAEIALAEKNQSTMLAIQPKKAAGDLRTNILRIVALIAVAGITIFIYNIRDRVEQFSTFGYPGIFLIALLANATILLPAPGVAIVYAMGAVFNPLGVGIAAGSGGAIGELSGYLAGFSGQAVIERTDIYERTKPWIDKYGGWAILVLSAIPNPFFDAAGIAAGIAKMPFRTFLFFVWIGQLIKMTIFAYAGRLSLDWLAQFLE